jgi:hypothetical protein
MDAVAWEGSVVDGFKLGIMVAKLSRRATTKITPATTAPTIVHIIPVTK